VLPFLEDGKELGKFSLTYSSKFHFMKKYFLIAAVGLLTTAGVTATVLSSNKKKSTKETTQKETKYKKTCTKSHRTACF
jgi:hypothetical protein